MAIVIIIFTPTNVDITKREQTPLPEKHICI